MIEPAPKLPPTGVEQPAVVTPTLVEAPADTSIQTDEAAVDSVAHIPVSEAPDDARWDHTKAETIGTALREEARDKGSAINPDLFDKTNVQEITSNLRRKEPDTWLVERHKKELGKLQHEANWRTSRGEEIPEDLEHATQEVQSNLNWALLNQIDPTGRLMEIAERDRLGKIANIEQDYEQLYDLNPELFAHMPTSEFMEILPEFKTVMEQASNAEWSEQLIERLQADLQTIASQRKVFEPKLSARMAFAVSEAMSLGDRQAKERIRLEVHRKFTEIDEAGNYDTTLGEIIEKKLEVMQQYLEPIAQKRQEAEQRKQEFMAKYAKNPEENSPTETQQAETPEQAVA